jgi:hypothetical protein
MSRTRLKLSEANVAGVHNLTKIVHIVDSKDSLVKRRHFSLLSINHILSIPYPTKKASGDLTIQDSFFLKRSLAFRQKPGIIINVIEREESMKQFNPVALELRSGKYKQRVIRNKKKYDRKRIVREKY